MHGKYADHELLSLALRIKARATRRCGELIAEIQAARGRRTDLELREGDHPKLTRSDAADKAGLSHHQRKTALRVANVSESVFESAIEAQRPATVSALAQLGTRHQPRPRPLQPKTETTYVLVEMPFRPSGPLEEVKVERQVATLMACWRDASPAAREHFLQNINARPASASE